VNAVGLAVARASAGLLAAVALALAAPAEADAKKAAPKTADSQREAVFLALVKERHIGPVTRQDWARHIGDDCIWVGRGLRVVGRSEVQGLQIDTGKRVEIQDFQVHDYGDTAVLTYLVVEHQPQAGRDVTTRLRKMDTYLSRDGGWRLVANAEVVGKPDRQAIELDAAVLDRYAGLYEIVLNGKTIRTRLWREGGHLFAQTEGQEKSKLLPLSATEFFDAGEPEEGGPVNLFVISDGGRAVEWIYRDGATEFRSRKVN
jgi:hypothetical protein